MIPLSMILAYYAFWVGLVWFLLGRYPGLAEYIPIVVGVFHNVSRASD